MCRVKVSIRVVRVLSHRTSSSMLSFLLWFQTNRLVKQLFKIINLVIPIISCSYPSWLCKRFCIVHDSALPWLVMESLKMILILLHLHCKGGHPVIFIIPLPGLNIFLGIPRRWSFLTWYSRAGGFLIMDAWLWLVPSCIVTSLLVWNQVLLLVRATTSFRLGSVRSINCTSKLTHWVLTSGLGWLEIKCSWMTGSFLRSLCCG